MRFLPTAALGGALLLAALVAGKAAEAPEGKTGLPVGTKAPAFTLKDQAGTEHSLDEFLKKGTMALVFYRSASW